MDVSLVSMGGLTRFRGQDVAPAGLRHSLRHGDEVTLYGKRSEEDERNEEFRVVITKVRRNGQYVGRDDEGKSVTFRARHVMLIGRKNPTEKRFPLSTLIAVAIAAGALVLLVTAILQWWRRRRAAAALSASQQAGVLNPPLSAVESTPSTAQTTTTATA